MQIYQKAHDWLFVQAVDSGVRNCLFIRSTLEDPNELSFAIFENLSTTKQAQSRHIMRLLPVLGSCKCEDPKISELALDLFTKHLKGVTQFTYALEVKVRANTDANKSHIFNSVNRSLSELKPLATVGLSNPDYFIAVNVIKRVCMISILKSFIKFRKYNVQEVTTTTTEVDKDDDNKSTAEDVQ